MRIGVLGTGDVGDITAARGMEVLVPFWVISYRKFQSPRFNFKIAR